MPYKVPYKYRGLMFALVMSLITSSVVSSIVIGVHSHTLSQFKALWPSSFFIAWPVVLTAILVIAPRVNRLLDWIVESDKR